MHITTFGISTIVLVAASAFGQSFKTLLSATGASAAIAKSNNSCTWTQPYFAPALNLFTKTIYEATTTSIQSVDCHGCNAITSIARFLGNGPKLAVKTTVTVPLSTATSSVCQTSKNVPTTPAVTSIDRRNLPPASSTIGCTWWSFTEATCPEQSKTATRYLKTVTETTPISCFGCTAFAYFTTKTCDASILQAKVVAPLTTVAVAASTAMETVCSAV